MTKNHLIFKTISFIREFKIFSNFKRKIFQYNYKYQIQYGDKTWDNMIYTKIQFMNNLVLRPNFNNPSDSCSKVYSGYPQERQYNLAKHLSTYM